MQQTADRISDQDKDQMRAEFMDEAMNKFHEIFMSSGFMQSTADMIQKKMLQNQEQGVNKIRKEESDGRNPTRYKSKTDRETGNRSKWNEGICPNIIHPHLSKLINRASTSELTVYKNAVENQINKRTSSSSEEDNEGMNISDNTINGLSDLMEIDQAPLDHLIPKTCDQEANNAMIENFISDVRERQRKTEGGRYVEDGQCPGTSGHQDIRHKHSEQGRNEKEKNYPDNRMRQLIKEVDLSRARVHETPGRNGYFSNDLNKDFMNDFIHSAIVDETYQLVASHVDEMTQEKIIRGDYVDFGQLVPKDRILTAEDNRYEMVIKEGKTFWVPANSHEVASISNYNRWEQTFRVFSDIYMTAHP